MAVLLLMGAWVVPPSVVAQGRQLSILVPAARGGGWDLTATAMAQALKQAGMAESVAIEYSPGAGGLIGLAQFVSSRRGDGNALLIGGLFTVGAVVPHRATISLLDTTPLARLTWDNTVVAVPASSKIKTADDLIESMLSASEAMSWVGGSRGGGDEMMLLQLARALGVSPSQLHYTALPGGGEVGIALAGGTFAAGISGYSEFESLVNDGRLRIIVVSSKDNLTYIDAPSFSDLGTRMERRNWRGVFAAPGIDAASLQSLNSAIDQMVRSAEWQQILKKHHWQDAYLSGPEFSEFIESEQQNAARDLADLQQTNQGDAKIISHVLLRRYAWALALGVLSIVLVVLMYYLHSRARRREEGLQHAFEEATGEANLRAEELEKALAGIHAQIEQEFETWELSSAESEIALLMLKGLRFKEIAKLRGTSERTVRQQAQTVYKKAGLSGRSDLAAYFIEDFMQSMEFRHEDKPSQVNN